MKKGDETMEFDQVEQLFKEYKKATGGIEPIGLTVPVGYPEGVEELGGIEAVYKLCITQRETWEKLLNYKEPPEDVWI